MSAEEIDEGGAEMIGLGEVTVCVQGGRQFSFQPDWKEADWKRKEDVLCVAVSRKKRNGVEAIFLDISLDKEKIDGKEGVSIRLQAPECDGFLAQYRHKEYWCSPFWADSLEHVPGETQALLWKEKGMFGFLLPVCGEQYKAVLNGDQLHVSSWYDGLKSCNSLACIIGMGENPGELISRCVRTGLELLPGSFPAREQRRYPELFNYLGWCSWDAFQIGVSEHGILEKCKEFKEKDIPVRWVILDDMWGAVRGLIDVNTPDYETVLEARHSMPLYSFEADPVRFPYGLEHCIRLVKKQYGIETGIWHPVSGYWSGIDRAGPLADVYQDCMTEGENGQLVPDYKWEKAFRFFDNYHQFLQDCGAAFVKIDNQSTIRRFYAGKAPVGEIARQIHKGIEASVGIHFDNRMINCMGMASENLWSRPVSALSRCSDDFLPDDREWFTKHLLQCSYNSLIQGAFLWCDWDMWWTSDGQAVKNSLLRAISGGPVYISDRLWESKREILMPLLLQDGRILRCDRPAVPTRDCLMENPEGSGKPFKIFSSCGEGFAVAAFNIGNSNKPVCGSIGPADLEDALEDCYAVYEHFTQTLRIVKKAERFSLSLKNADDFRFFLFLPVKEGRAWIGLKEKYLSPCTIEEYDVSHVLLKESGSFLFYSQEEVRTVWVNGKRTSAIREENGLYVIYCDGMGKQWITISKSER